jgi:hypothetical protein
MGSKLKPDKFDCLDRAEPDEEFFLLLARDPLFVGMVELWAALRANEPDVALGVFATLLTDAARMSPDLGHRAKINAARDCARRGGSWRAAKRLGFGMRLRDREPDGDEG